MAYVKTPWKNDQLPYINASNLNKIEQGISDNSLGIASLNSNKIGIKDTFPISIITTDSFNPAPYTYYLIDASIGAINITLPTVGVDDDQWYSFTLIKNSHHVTLTVDGVQEIANETSISISTVNTQVLIKANKNNGYYNIQDSRELYRVNLVTDSLDLSGGYESGALYVCSPSDSTEMMITIKDTDMLHKGDWAKFLKVSGENSIVRIKSLDDSFNEILTKDNTSIELTCTENNYIITQDSREGDKDISINFFPSNNVSIYEPMYNVLETDTFTSSTIVTDTINSIDPINPTSLGFFINDNKALLGLLSEKNTTAYSNIKVSATSSDKCKIKFRYYEYDLDTLTLNPLYLMETSYSTVFENTTSFNEVSVTGIIPENEWVNNTNNKVLVIELLAIKTRNTRNPTLEFKIGGTDASRNVIDVPISSMNHNALGGVVPAGLGVPDGHINTDTQDIYGSKTFKDIISLELNTFEDDTSAGIGGLLTNQLYKTSTGEIRIKL